MEIFYTEITQDLTEKLLALAQEEMAKKRKVFYIVPSSMSFEKEKEILERLNNGADAAVFDLLVTRFKQLPYYFVKNDAVSQKVELSQAGLSMLFRKVLKSFSKEEIPLYFGLQNSAGFFDLLVNLRKELQEGNLSADDLPDSDKNRELKLILNRFEAELSTDFANYSEFGDFTERIEAGEFDEALRDVVCIIDGYTRFSAMEEKFIAAIHSRVRRLIIGTFADAVPAGVNQEDSVYANALQMMADFTAKYGAVRQKVETKVVNSVYSKLTDLIKADHTFVMSDRQLVIADEEAEQFSIWEAENQTVEIERVAKEIRQKIAEGASFKDFTVLVGNPELYEIPVKEIFELYEIPYFYAQEEKMSHHPLIVFMESLAAVKLNNYRTDDVLNLVKCKLYGPLESGQEVLDYFEYYVQQNKIQGRKKFEEPFEEKEYLHYAEVEQFRQELFGERSALQEFLSSNNLILGKTWLSKFQAFFENGQIMEHLNGLYRDSEAEKDHISADKHEQVWNLLLSALTEFQAVFEQQKLRVNDFLDIILAGLRNANYRQIPANVDVVNVKDYELVEPRTNRFVYAIGLSQTNFPRSKVNSTLLSDEERLEINQATQDDQFIEPLNLVNYQKATFNSLSLVNAATEKLVLSMPQIVENVQDDISPVIQLFLTHAESGIKQNISSYDLDKKLENIGNARSVISSIGKIERELHEISVSADRKVFWSSIFRLLTKNDENFRQILLSLDKDIATVNLSPDTVNQVYNGQIYASVSAFERFYNCEFQYFVENTLGLEVFEDIDINSKVVGNFFHEVFEKLLKVENLNSDNFDDFLKEIIATVNQDYQRYFKRDATARFTWENLEEIISQTAVMLKRNVASTALQTKMTESSFGLPKSELGEFVIDDIHLRGRIDRIDATAAGRLGAIDYKSSSHQFKLQDAYDGLSLQFLTYLDVLQHAFADHKLWGALYLQFQNNPVNLSSVNQVYELGLQLDKAMEYQGLLLADSLDEIGQIDGIRVNKKNVYQASEFANLLRLNEWHYKQAGQWLRQGEVKINPVMKRSEGIDRTGNVQGCRYCPLKSICRFEANVHMRDYTREIGIKSPAEIMAELGEKVEND